MQVEKMFMLPRATFDRTPGAWAPSQICMGGNDSAACKDGQSVRRAHAAGITTCSVAGFSALGDS